jgi:hypothetical protein
MLAVKIELEKKLNSLNVEISAVRSCVLLHKEQKENLIVTHNKQIEEKEETMSVTKESRCCYCKKVSCLLERHSKELHDREQKNIWMLCDTIHMFSFNNKHFLVYLSLFV